MEYSEALVDYCRGRLAQLESFRPVLSFYRSEHMIDRYGGALVQIIREVEDSKNADYDKVRNINYYLASNIDSLFLFSEDISAIQAGKPLVLPEKILDIPIFLEERRKQEEEKQRQIREEASAREWQEVQRRMAKVEAERKKARQLQLANELGIPIETLARLQGK